jgi:hypothetical protein
MDVFLHIPRTAGQSLSQLVLQNYDNRRILFTGDSFEEVRQLSRLTELDGDACMGHIPWGTFANLRTMVNYIAFLRHPIARLLSEYAFHKYTKGAYHHQAIRDGLSARDWLKLGRHPGNEIMRNTMCRFLSGVYVWGEINPRTTARAKETLCRMAAFGIIEMFDESVLLIGKALKLRHLFVVPTNIKQQGDSSATPLPEYDEMFSYDLELYEFAVQLLNDRIDRLGAVFTDALAAYRETSNRLHLEFASISDRTVGYEQPAELIRQLREINQPAPIAALYAQPG